MVKLQNDEKDMIDDGLIEIEKRFKEFYNENDLKFDVDITEEHIFKEKFDMYYKVINDRENNNENSIHMPIKFKKDKLYLRSFKYKSTSILQTDLKHKTGEPILISLNNKVRDQFLNNEIIDLNINNYWWSYVDVKNAEYAKENVIVINGHYLYHHLMPQIFTNDNFKEFEKRYYAFIKYLKFKLKKKQKIHTYKLFEIFKNDEFLQNGFWYLSLFLFDRCNIIFSANYLFTVISKALIIGKNNIIEIQQKDILKNYNNKYLIDNNLKIEDLENSLFSNYYDD